MSSPDASNRDNHPQRPVCEQSSDSRSRSRSRSVSVSVSVSDSDSCSASARDANAGQPHVEQSKFPLGNSLSEASSDDFHVIRVSDTATTSPPPPPQSLSPDASVPTPHALSDAQYDNLRTWIRDVVDAEQRTGLTFSDSIRSNAQFNNPAIYQRMVSFCAIDPFGSHVSHRQPLTSDDYYDALNKTQHLQMQHSL